MAEGAAAVDAMCARLRALGGSMPELAQRVAVEVEREIGAQIARGEGPDGVKWPLTQDGRQALVHAAKSLRVVAQGTTVVITINGVEARHHLGRVRGGLARQIIPSARIPAPLARAIDRVVQERMHAALGGA